MTDPLTRRTKAIRKRNRKKPLSEEIRAVYRLLSAMLIFMAVAAGSGHLLINADSSTQGYTLRELQLQQERLEYQSRQLDHLVLTAKSFENLESNNLIEDMAPTPKDDLSFMNDSAYAQAL